MVWFSILRAFEQVQVAATDGVTDGREGVFARRASRRTGPAVHDPPCAPTTNYRRLNIDPEPLMIEGPRAADS